MPPDPPTMSQCRWCKALVEPRERAAHEKDCADNPANSTNGDKRRKGR